MGDAAEESSEAHGDGGYVLVVTAAAVAAGSEMQAIIEPVER